MLVVPGLEDRCRRIAAWRSDPGLAFPEPDPAAQFERSDADGTGMSFDSEVSCSHERFSYLHH